VVIEAGQPSAYMVAEIGVGSFPRPPLGVGCASNSRIGASHLGVLSTPRVDAEMFAAGRRRQRLGR
jgi:hypothetical protein